jgi:MinD-like ATPase involved in chromosome partitioning or flagellar assembly
VIARTLKRTPAVAVPFDPAQARALATATPLALGGPDSPLAQAVQGLAQTLEQAAQG